MNNKEFFKIRKTLGLSQEKLSSILEKADEIDKERILLYAMQRVVKVEE